MQKPLVPDVNELITRIEDRIGIKLDFPNPFPNEFGLISKRGIISQRAIQAVYQAVRIRNLTLEFGGAVIEIGAGLGRTAYYAKKLGVKDYTIVDLPLVNVAQAAFLGTVLGPDQVVLYGEGDADAIRIMPAHWIPGTREKFDVYFNADSLTEMNLSDIMFYSDRFLKNGKVFLSINHEANVYRVSEIKTISQLQTSRTPYWFRDGYTEEIFVNKRSD